MRIGTICGLVAVAGIAAYLGYKTATESQKNEEKSQQEAKNVVADEIAATDDLPLETIQTESITDAANSFAETKSNAFEDITDRHLEGGKVIVESVSAIFENDKRIAERKAKADVVEMPSENDTALDDIMNKLK